MNEQEEDERKIIKETTTKSHEQIRAHSQSHICRKKLNESRVINESTNIGECIFSF